MYRCHLKCRERAAKLSSDVLPTLDSNSEAINKVIDEAKTIVQSITENNEKINAQLAAVTGGVTQVLKAVNADRVEVNGMKHRVQDAQSQVASLQANVSSHSMLASICYI